MTVPQSLLFFESRYWMLSLRILAEVEKTSIARARRDVLNKYDDLKRWAKLGEVCIY